MQSDKKVHTAYNESGHAVAYYHFGIPLISVTVIPDKKGNDGLTTPMDMTILKKTKIMISYAGPAAEKLCLGKPGPGSIGDLLAANKYDFSKTELDDLNKQITVILKQPKYLYAIKILAKELLQKETLMGSETFSLIENAIKKFDSV